MGVPGFLDRMLLEPPEDGKVVLLLLDRLGQGLLGCGGLCICLETRLSGLRRQVFPVGYDG